MRRQIPHAESDLAVAGGPSTGEVPLNRSRFLAGLIGPTACAVAVSMLINPGLVVDLAETVQGEIAFVLVAGLLALVPGLAIVMSHNLWRGWPAVITIFGWLCVFGGLARILFPYQVLAAAAAAADTGTPAAPAVAAALFFFGLFLSWKAFLPSRTESV